MSMLCKWKTIERCSAKLHLLGHCAIYYIENAWT